MRGVAPVAALAAALAQPAGSEAPLAAPQPVAAAFTAPTGRYPHGVLGSLPTWGALVADLRDGAGTRRVRVDLPSTRVFEDVAPRLWDVTGDGLPEVVAVESDLGVGSRLAAWAAVAGEGGPALALLAATPFIGTRFRWLAPLGAADLDGDGRVEVAYVETPHRARVLRVVTLAGDAFAEVASLPGVTNHAVGEEAITGGIRRCPGRPPEIVALSGDRGLALAIRFEDGRLVPEALGAASDLAVADALACWS